MRPGWSRLALSSCFATGSTAARFELVELAEFQLFHLLTVPGGVSAFRWERGQKGDVKHIHSHGRGHQLPSGVRLLCWKGHR